MKLTRKLLIRIIGLLMISSFVIGGYGVVKTYDNTQALMDDQLQTELRLSTALIEEKLAGLRGMIDVYTENPLVIEALRKGQFDNRLQEGFTETLKKNQGMMDLLSIVDSKGKVLISDSINKAEGADLSQRDYLQKTAQTKTIQVSNVVISQATGLPVIAISAPVLSNGQYIGAVVATLSFDQIASLIDDVKIGENGYAYMIIKEGEDAGLVIAHPDSEKVMKLNLKDLNNKGLNKLLADMETKDHGEGDYTYKGDDKHVKYQSIEHWDLLITVNQSDIDASAIEIRNITGLVLLIAILVSSGAGWWVINKSIIKPVMALQASMALAGDGDLTHRVDIQTKDEIETLANDYNKMLDNQKEILKGVAQVSQDLSASAEELTASAEEVNASSEEVSDRVTTMMENVMNEQKEVEEVQSNTTKLGHEAGNTFELTAQSKASCEQAASVAEAGREGVQNSIESMSGISLSTQSVIMAFEELNEKAKEVTGISTIISSIAEQINLLALNASIEAARAGEAGRGFSVVAEEVRKLAEQTTLESENIFNVLNRITSLIGQADAYVKDTKDKVDEGERSITSLDGRFVTLMTSVESLTDALDHLKTVSENQLEGAKSIEASIDNVSGLTQSNTSMAQEIAASCEEQVAITESLSQASEEASSMAEHLNNLISRFKL